MGLIIIASVILTAYSMMKIIEWKNHAQLYNEKKSRLPQLDREIEALKNERMRFNKERENFETEKKREYSKIELKNKELEKIAEEKSVGFPWLSEAYADYFYMEDLKTSKHLKTKKHPAKKAAEEVKRVGKEKREAIKKQKINEYLISYYESLFPWLEDFKEVEDDDIIKISDENLNQADNEDKVAKWLSPKEYSELPVSVRNQKALDRYFQKKKSKWEIGRDYERYVGYQYERRGYQVDYVGIENGLADMGRDLIARKDGCIEIIQCKYWSKHKTIHEKHIFQLFGTTIEYFIKNQKLKSDTQLDFFVDLLKGANIKAVFITSIKLSEMAMSVAKALNIKVVQSYKLKEYPIIKCNISKVNGERIYHLPFDQQYDNVKIEPKEGECYVSTVKEAENLGFRRAFRWSGNK